MDLVLVCHLDMCGLLCCLNPLALLCLSISLCYVVFRILFIVVHPKHVCG